MDKIILKNKKVNLEKLLDYGFTKRDDSYFLTVPIFDSQFEMKIQILSDGQLEIKTIELATQDEYVLHLTGAVGEFVGKVKAEYEKVLQDILDKCYELDIYKSKQAHQIIEYAGEKYGDDLEFLWQKFPDCAVLRRKDNKKWYAILMVVSKRKLKIDSDELVEVIDLRADENEIQNLVNGSSFFEGYHMNKKHWMSICLDNGVDIKDILKYIDDSYALAKK